MNWHKDTLLYEIPQYEFVFTLNNNRIHTLFKDNNNNIKKIKQNLIHLLASTWYNHSDTVRNGSRVY